jgi:hypothetical protein
MAVQTTGLEPVHVPLWQVLVWKHRLLLVQGMPLVAAGFEHIPVE